MNKTGTEASSKPLAMPRAPTIYRVCGRPSADDRPPLPPGHPESWGLLIEGTILQDTPYPFPVFN